MTARESTAPARAADGRAPAGMKVDLGVVAGIVLFGAVFWCCRMVLTQTKPLFASTDYFLQIYPMTAATAGSYTSGALPLWEPYQSCGVPMMAAAIHGPVYPLNLAYLFLPTGLAIEVTQALHVVAAGVFMYAYGRAIRLARLAAVASGVSFMLSGFVTFEASWYSSALASVTWLPLGWCAVELIARTRRFRWVALLALAVSMPMLSGYLQTWLYSMWSVAMYMAIRLVVMIVSTWRHGGEDRWEQAASNGERVQYGDAARVAAMFALGGVLGVGLACLQLLPTRELQSLSGRPPSGLTVNEILPFGGYRLRMLFADAISSAPELPRLGYVGIASIPLLAAAPLAWPARRFDARAWLLVGISVGAILLAISGGTRFFDLYLALPGARLFRAPQRILALHAGAVAALVGIAFERVLVSDAGARGRRGIAVVLALAGIAAVIVPGLPLLTRAYLVGAAGLVACAVFATRPSARRWIAAGVAALVTFDLFVACKMEAIRPFLRGEVLRAEAATWEYLRENQGYHRTYMHPVATHFSLALMDKQATLHHVYSVSDYNSLSIGRFGRLYRSLTPPKSQLLREGPFLGKVELDPGDPRFRLVELLSVRYVVADRGAPGFAAKMAKLPVWREIRTSDELTVYEHVDPLPRAYLAHDVIPATSEDDAFRRLDDASFDLRRSIIVEDESAARGSNLPISPAQITRYEPTRVEIDTEGAVDGELVLTDTFFPGWTADVDGRPAPIRRANYLFRAVSVPAGHHHVTFTYVPRTLMTGALLSFLSAAACLGLIVYDRRRRR